MDVLHKCKETCSTFRICMGMGVCFGVYSCKCTTHTRGNKYKFAGASFFSASNMTLQSLLMIWSLPQIQGILEKVDYR